MGPELLLRLLLNLGIYDIRLSLNDIYYFIIYIILITYFTFKLWKYMIMCIVMQLDFKHKLYCFFCSLCTYPVGDFMDVFSVIAFWVLIIPWDRLSCRNFHLWNYVGVQKLYILENFIFWIFYQERSTCTQIICSYAEKTVRQRISSQN